MEQHSATLLRCISRLYIHGTYWRTCCNLLVYGRGKITTSETNSETNSETLNLKE